MTAQADAQYDQGVAQAAQSKASADVAAVNVARTFIRSPIDGVVVSRNLDVGQTGEHLHFGQILGGTADVPFLSSPQRLW